MSEEKRIEDLAKKMEPHVEQLVKDAFKAGHQKGYEYAKRNKKVKINNVSIERFNNEYLECLRLELSKVGKVLSDNSKEVIMLNDFCKQIRNNNLVLSKE